jgi:hypothetical protein
MAIFILFFALAVISCSHGNDTTPTYEECYEKI